MGNNYERQQTLFSVVGSFASNSTAATFGPASLAWGTMTTLGVFDAPVGGNCLWQGNLSAPTYVDFGSGLTIDAGALQLQLA